MLHRYLPPEGTLVHFGNLPESRLFFESKTLPGGAGYNAALGSGVYGWLARVRRLPVGIAGEGGQVVSVLVQPGQWVRQGQTLAVIDRSVQVQQAASQSAQIQSAMKQALAEAAGRI